MIFSCRVVVVKYDAEKLIAYPGFNVSCPDGVVDVSIRESLY